MKNLKMEFLVDDLSDLLLINLEPRLSFSLIKMKLILSIWIY